MKHKHEYMKQLRYKKLFQYFLQGLLVLAPISITIWAIAVTFNFIDGILPNLIHFFLPGIMEDTAGNIRRIPGVGFIVLLLIVLFFGYISSFFIFNKVATLFDEFLQKIPVVKYVYTTVRDFFGAFAGENKKFTKSVLVNVDDKDIWRVGFVTQEDMEEFGFKDYVAVYVPLSYSVAGNLFIVPKDRIKPITNISPTQSMKFAVSGGVTSIEENEKGETQVNK